MYSVKDYKRLLHLKMQDEYAHFVEELDNMTPQQVRDKAFEIVSKQDILFCVENSVITQTEAKALYQLDKPLDAVWENWNLSDMSYMNLIHRAIEDKAKDAVKEMKDKQRESR